MVSEKLLVLVFLALSVTCTVKLKAPFSVGAPFSTPLVAFNSKPAGSPPDAQVYGGSPPLAANV
jgi:hypothetical protein